MTTATTQRPLTPSTAPGRVDALAGTWRLVRFMLRRDRVRIGAWIAGLTVLTLASASNFATLYATEADRQTIAATTDSPAMIAMVGINHGAADYHYGAMMGHQMLWFTAVLVAVMSVLLVVRHTRSEEATGRAELVRSGIVGRHATTVAALAVVAGVNVALAVAMAVGLGTTGLEGITWSGSWLYGAAHVAAGMTFAGVAVVTVQVTEHSRGASGMALGAIGLAYAMRAVGDVGGGALSWLSPIGWIQATEVYVSDRWWPLLLAIAVAGALVAVGLHLSTRRDVGAGLRRPRPGPAAPSAWLTGPFGLAFRLHRAPLVGWSVALVLLGVMYGSVLGDAEQMIADIEALGDFLPEVAGVGITEAFAAGITSVVAVIAAIYAVLAALKVRTEETAGRAEPILATSVSRTRWVASNLAVAAIGSAVVLLAGGLGLGAAGAAATGDVGLLPALVGAALAYTPALWVTVGIVAVLFGVFPRGVALAWFVVGYSFVVVYLGGMLQLPAWMSDLSPFGHVPQLPVDDLAVAPLAVLSVVAVALAAVGVTGFQRRDLESTT